MNSSELYGETGLSVVGIILCIALLNFSLYSDATKELNKLKIYMHANTFCLSLTSIEAFHFIKTISNIEHTVVVCK